MKIVLLCIVISMLLLVASAKANSRNQAEGENKKENSAENAGSAEKDKPLNEVCTKLNKPMDKLCTGSSSGKAACERCFLRAVKVACFSTDDDTPPCSDLVDCVSNLDVEC